jgi:hypothetical protein
MRSRRLHHRLDAIVRAQPTPARRLLTISPEDWPAEVLAAWDRACAVGDWETQAALIQQQTGERVRLDGGPPPHIIELRTTPDGPV